MLGCAASVLSHHAESVRVVDEYPEIVFLLEGDNLVEYPEGTCHAIDAFGYEEDSAACLLAELGRPLEGGFTALDVVVAVGHPFTHVEPGTVYEAGMGLRVIDNDVVPVHQGVYCGDDSLVAEIEEERILLFLEIGKLPLELLVEGSMSGHHTAAHRVCKPPFRRSLGVPPSSLPDDWQGRDNC